MSFLRMCLLSPRLHDGMEAAAANATNLALQKPVFASSRHNANIGYYGPELAVDGDTNSTGQLFQTRFGDMKPWLSIDLGVMSIITQIIIFGCTDCNCNPLMSGVEVRLGNTAITQSPNTDMITLNALVWRLEDVATYPGPVYSIIPTAPIVGRWLTVQNFGMWANCSRCWYGVIQFVTPLIS